MREEVRGELEGVCVEVGTPRRRRLGTRTDFRRGAPAAARGRKEARGLWGGGGAVPPSRPWGP